MSSEVETSLAIRSLKIKDSSTALGMTRKRAHATLPSQRSMPVADSLLVVKVGKARLRPPQAVFFAKSSMDEPALELVC